MHTVSKSYLKTHMLRVFREIEKSGAELVVTANNRPVLKIVPVRQGNSVGEVFGELQGKIAYSEGINTPTEEEWSEL